MHNMDDEMPFASHVTTRGRVYQYIRRIPEDIVDCFPFTRVQRSLRTPDKAVAYEAAARVHAEFEKQFAAARRKKGTTVNLIPVDDWEWPDWQHLADWFKAVLLERDWSARLRALPGGVFDSGVDRKHFWREDQIVRAHIDLRAQLREMTVATYAQDRFGFVQGKVRPLGVPISKSMPYFERFMGACLKAEIAYLATFFDREGGTMEEAPHPDTIQGKWRPAANHLSEQQVARITGHEPAQAKNAGKTLADCLEQWKSDRLRANKKVTKHNTDEKNQAIDAFESHAGVKDIAGITRAKVVAFRDYLFTTGLKTPTVNKKVGNITTLVATAQKAGWIETAINGGIYTEVPAGTNEREPFENAELDLIFSQDAFCKGRRSDSVKSGGELEFWLPLISLVSGLISSEILQLGPESVGPHPEHPEIMCFTITNAGGRSTKSVARRRYVPVHQVLLDHGFLQIVSMAQRKGWKTLWQSVENSENFTSVSNMFSAFWSDFLRNQLDITDPMKTLYSLRHNFRDAMSACSATDYEKDQLMGHAEVGTGKKYGTKKKPRVVDIFRLNQLVQMASWPCLTKIVSPPFD